MALAPALAWPARARAGDGAGDREVRASTVDAGDSTSTGLQLGWGPDELAEPALAPAVMGSLRVLDERAHGVDLAIGGGWQPHGFNGVGEAVLRVSAGAHVGGTYLVGATSLGMASDQLGSPDAERYGELALAAMRRAGPGLFAGLATSLRADLQHDTDPSTEAAWQVLAGPVASYSLGSFALTATTGLSVWQFHQAAHEDVGAVAMLGVATTL